MYEQSCLKSIYDQLCNHSDGAVFMKKFTNAIIDPTHNDRVFYIKLRYDPEDARDFHYEIVFFPPVYSYVCGSIQVRVIKNSLNDRHILHTPHRQSCICIAGNIGFYVDSLIDYMKLVDTYSMDIRQRFNNENHVHHPTIGKKMYINPR